MRFTSSLIASLLLHGVAVMLGSMSVKHANIARSENPIPIGLFEVSRTAEKPPLQRQETQPEIHKPAPQRSGEKKPDPQHAKKAASLPSERPIPSSIPLEGQSPKKVEAHHFALTKPETDPRIASETNISGQDNNESAAGDALGNHGGNVVHGSGIAGRGGSDLGGGSGTRSLPTQGSVLRTNREAKPIQTAKAAYPPMALRMGLESDVALKIEVDADGRVTKVEISKSGGAGFDEEALKAIKQSRFEPAQKDGQNVSAEFTYVYRFRLQR